MHFDELSKNVLSVTLNFPPGHNLAPSNVPIMGEKKKSSEIH